MLYILYINLQFAGHTAKNTLPSKSKKIRIQIGGELITTKNIFPQFAPIILIAITPSHLRIPALHHIFESMGFNTIFTK